MRSFSAFLGLFALIAATIVFMAGTGGIDPRAESGPTKWITAGILIAIIAAWIAAMIADALRQPSPHHAAEDAVPAAAHDDRGEPPVDDAPRRSRRAPREHTMRSPSAFLGLFALTAATIVFLAGTGGIDPRAESGPTKWIVAGILIAIIAAWIAAMIADALRDSPPDHAAAEAAAAAGDDRHAPRHPGVGRDGLDRLSALLEQGAITQDEYDARRAEILRGP